MPFNPEMNVLIVDDASAMRRIVRGLLKELGFKNIREAGNGQLALDELKKKKADFVVTDGNMPVMTADTKPKNIVEAVQAGSTITSSSRSTQRRCWRS